MRNSWLGVGTKYGRGDVMRDLHRMYPSMRSPIHCENGCGAVIECLEAFRSYEKDEQGDPKLICQCCAAEIGHLDEDDESPDESPVCHRPEKRQAK
mgnify:CR=1 FL=1